ncbi:MAG: TetR/AcrR family transcriptional regulator [Sphingobacteriales bacterium]|nr:TetR/AcrR family transcriptional regulator [Sphingobacteriales bacterium]
MKANSKVRARVMDTVTRLFYEQGFQATGINQIIEESEVAKASLYEHFPSKEAILQAYLEDATAQWRSEFEEFCKGKAAGDKTILALFDYRKFLAVKRGFKGCTFIRVVYEMPNLDKAALEVILRHKEYIRKMLKENIALLPSRRSPKEVEELAEMIVSLYEGCGVQSSLERSARSIDSARKIAQKLLE